VSEHEVEAGHVPDLLPAVVHHYFPVKGGVEANGDGTVTFHFFTKHLEIVDITIPGEAAAALREEIPASSGILTPPAPRIIVPS